MQWVAPLRLKITAPTQTQAVRVNARVSIPTSLTGALHPTIHSFSQTVSSGFEIYNRHLPGVLLFSQAFVSHLPALTSVMFAGFSGSISLQCDGVTFAVSK